MAAARGRNSWKMALARTAQVVKEPQQIKDHADQRYAPVVRDSWRMANARSARSTPDHQETRPGAPTTAALRPNGTRRTGAASNAKGIQGPNLRKTGTCVAQISAVIGRSCSWMAAVNCAQSTPDAKGNMTALPIDVQRMR